MTGVTVNCELFSVSTKKRLRSDRKALINSVSENVEKACQDFRSWVYLNLASDQTLLIPSFWADEF